MSFSPVTIASLDTVDRSAPGAPGINGLAQVGERIGEFTFVPPTLDADGSPLTGLTFAQVVTIQARAEEVEQYRNDFEAAISAPGAELQTLDLVDGEAVRVTFAIGNPGKPYSVIARCADHERV